MTDVFRCDRLRMTLSPAGCSRLWEAAQRKRPEPWERRFACRHCPIGAAHAGTLKSAKAGSAVGGATASGAGGR